ncbi:hypothetical protein IF1G_02043 [Cordyceps javanica]|uniref:Uncharacterized protein n=1 Tax=Cordyceps javanica TaxID=43265 RepID=A0A545VDN9_9HYPO|nr:hypothetical protein IF1G_02043 [Cordyceps javanica]
MPFSTNQEIDEASPGSPIIRAPLCRPFPTPSQLLSTTSSPIILLIPAPPHTVQ